MSKTLAELPVGSLIIDPNTKYYGVPIVWMKLEDDHDGVGNTTLITEKIITLKCFDAKEPNNGNTGRKNYGNNRYSVSNIRQWLNSDAAAGEWYSAQHTYDAPPNSSNVYQGSSISINPYDTEAGFLNGFSEEFKAILQSITKTVAKLTVEGGNSRSETVTDKIFLLSNPEVGYSNDDNVAEGTLYSYFNSNDSRKCKCTIEAITNSNYNSNPTVNDNWYWLLRTPRTYNVDYCGVYYIGTAGTRSYYDAYYSFEGIRPACVISSTTKVLDFPNANGYYEITYNSSPTLILSTTSLGQVSTSPTLTFTVDDEDNNLLLLTVSLDGTVFESLDLSNITLGSSTSYTLSSTIFESLSENQHILTFTATDSKNASISVSCTFTKFISGSNSRLVNRNDAAQLISALNAIANRNGYRFVKPTLSSSTITYDGEAHNVSEILSNFNSSYMLVTGDVSVIDDIGEHTINIQLKRSRDSWADDTTSVLTYTYSLVDGGE